MQSMKKGVEGRTQEKGVVSGTQSVDAQDDEFMDNDYAKGDDEYIDEYVLDLQQDDDLFEKEEVEKATKLDHHSIPRENEIQEEEDTKLEDMDLLDSKIYIAHGYRKDSQPCELGHL
ncbi:hypothetical protein NDU88_003285 [Pleurodeles waltl]|uniref:Uncharacterized protein n=1 Tax=Pleurodeles waltl TaxID=8319 RepID=A0AAV7LI47_PLEWA|nr:hypothetical protein NDU88_003285 [Pleurodeles waltl]